MPARERIFHYGPAFVPLAAFLAWGGFAWAVGMHWRAVLGVGALACATALGYALVIASRPRRRALPRAVETRWNPEG